MNNAGKQALKAFLCILALAGAGHLHAQSATAEESSPALRLVSVLGEDRPDRYIEIMRRAVAPYLAGVPCPQAHRLVDGFLSETKASMAQYLDRNGYAQRVAGIYESEFSAQELDELTAFFESDIGRRLLEARMALFEKNYQLSQVFFVGYEPEFNARLDRLRSEINRLPPSCGL